MSTVESTVGLSAEQAVAAAQAGNAMMESDEDFTEDQMDTARATAAQATADFHSMSHAASEQAKLDEAAGLAPAAEDAPEEDGEMLKGAALKERASELGISSGMTADETRAAIAEAEAADAEGLEELHGVMEPMADPAAEAAAAEEDDTEGHVQARAKVK